MIVSFLIASALTGFFNDLPVGKDPGSISRRITDQFLSTRPENYYPAGYHGNGGYGWNRIVQYSVVSAWLNGIGCARLTGDSYRQEQLIRMFDDFLPGGCKNRICSRPWHVDDTIFGALPLEIYLANNDRRCYDMGMFYADNQWCAPCDESVKERESAPREIQDEYFRCGYSVQTRLWIDDMYMITVLQSQAYRATGDRKYIERAANEMCFYLDKLQLKDGAARGLFYHAPDVPYIWGRGDGWMAAGMALVLDRLPEDSPHRARIMEGYHLMMETLLKYQRADGLWCQLVDRPDDDRNWGETSSTAMFAYAYMVGVRRGWLDASIYGPSARKAYLALCDRMDAFGNIDGVCEGTGKKNDLVYYFNRRRVNGDPHGQAPMLWIANVLLEDGAGIVSGVKTPETSKLFEKRIDPESGVVSYSLIHGQKNDNRQSLYFVTKSMTEDGRFLVFMYNSGNERKKCGKRVLMVADMLKDEVSEIGVVWGTPFIDCKDGYIVYFERDKGFFRMDLSNPGKDKAVKLCDIPDGLTSQGKLLSLASHLTLTKDRSKAFLDSCVVTPEGTTNFVQGLVSLKNGEYESWGRTDFFCNHGQINPARDDLAMCAWEYAWERQGREYKEKTGWYPRMWIIEPNGRRTLIPARESNFASHEIWDDDGKGFSWCGNGKTHGVYHHDLASGKQECICPILGARHDTLSPDNKYVVYDQAPSEWWRGCKWRVGFWNRETQRNVWVYTTRPALMPKDKPSRFHPDPHPHFVCRGKYIVSTANNADGHMDLYVTPVDQLVARTTMDVPSGKRVQVSNPISVRRPSETVSVRWKDLGLNPEDTSIRVWDVSECRPVAYQDDCRGNLLFATALEAKEVKTFIITADHSLPQADQSIVCWSQHLPERMDDFAWENDRFGARAYGPIIMEPAPKGQGLVSSGIDIINKCVGYPVLHKWFTGMKNEGSYHKDHGEGMDNYKVGPSRGCGGIGMLVDGTWQYSSNWVKAKVFMTGPVRTQFELTYPDWGGLGSETRRVTVDRGCDFARFDVILKNRPKANSKVGPGLDCSKQRQHNGSITRDLDRAWIANWEPKDVDGKGTGTIATGILLDPAMGTAETARDGIGCEYLFPSRTDRTLVYWAGAAWSGAGCYTDEKAWVRAVGDFAESLRNPIKVVVK